MHSSSSAYGLMLALCRGLRAYPYRGNHAAVSEQHPFRLLLRPCSLGPSPKSLIASSRSVIYLANKTLGLRKAQTWKRPRSFPFAYFAPPALLCLAQLLTMFPIGRRPQHECSCSAADLGGPRWQNSWSWGMPSDMANRIMIEPGPRHH